MKVSDLFSEGNPFDFAAPVVKFKKLDDLPKKPHSAKDVQKAMHALHKMVHAQAHSYGGKNGKLLPVGITELKLGAKKSNDDFIGAWLAATTEHPFDRKMRLWDGDVGVSVDDFGGEIYLELITTFGEKGTGRASAAMKFLTSLADKHGATIRLYAKPVKNAGSKGRDLTASQLKTWYKRHGFEADGDEMIRRPATIKEDISPSEQKRRQELYKRWRELINMSADSIENFVKSQTEKGRKDPKKYPGMKPQAAASMGISSGVQSARWIAKMKRTPVKDWTPEMWKWAGKQVSFVSRMLGNSGPLYDDKGEPTRKLLSLKVWGHNPR